MGNVAFNVLKSNVRNRAMPGAKTNDANYEAVHERKSENRFEISALLTRTNREQYCQ